MGLKGKLKNAKGKGEQLEVLSLEETGKAPLPQISFPLMETGDIFSDVSSLIEKARSAAYKSVNVLLVQRNWLIGKRIHDEELKNTRKENYGLEVIKALSKKLTDKYGKGFGNASLYSYLTFYKTYQNIFQTVFGESFLSWPPLPDFDAGRRRKSQAMV